MTGTVVLLATAVGSFQQVRLDRPVVCVSASIKANEVVAAGASELGDSVRDLDRALRTLGRRRFDVRPDGPICTIRLTVVSRSDNEDAETRTLAVRLSAQPLDRPLHVEDLRAVEGSWRDAAASIARKVRFFVDQNREKLADDVDGAAGDHEPQLLPDTEPAPRLPAADAEPAAALTSSLGAPEIVEDGILDWVRVVAAPAGTLGGEPLR